MQVRHCTLPVDIHLITTDPIGFRSLFYFIFCLLFLIHVSLCLAFILFASARIQLSSAAPSPVAPRSLTTATKLPTLPSQAYMSCNLGNGITYLIPVDVANIHNPKDNISKACAAPLTRSRPPLLRQTPRGASTLRSTPSPVVPAPGAAGPESPSPYPARPPRAPKLRKPAPSRPWIPT